MYWSRGRIKGKLVVHWPYKVPTNTAANYFRAVLYVYLFVLRFCYVFYKYRNSLCYLSSVRETCRTKVVPQRMYKLYIIPRIVCTVFLCHTCESYPTLLLVPFSYSTTDFSSILSDTNLPNLFRDPFH